MTVKLNANFAIVLLVICSSTFLSVAMSQPLSNKDFIELDFQSQKVKLRVVDLTRDINKYVAKSSTKYANQFKGRQRTEFSMDLVLKDYKNKSYLSAINRYHSGRDFGVTKSKYETALKVANIYLDYGLHDYSKKIFNSLLGDEDSAVASLARYYLAKHNYTKHKWDEALSGFESVIDGLPQEELDKKNIMHGILLQNKIQHDEAIKVFAKVPKSSRHYSHAQFNMAMSFLKKGWWSDADGTILGIVKKQEPNNDESLYLKDRFYIALGYAQLQREYYRDAYLSLQKVSEKGPYSYKAQLGMGLVAAEQGKYKQALMIIDKLTNTYSQNLVTEEAHIIIPFLLESVQSIEITSEYYHNSIEYYRNAVAEIDSTTKSVEAGMHDKEFINSKSLSKKPEIGPINRYLYELMATNKWQESIRNYQDLNHLNHHLKELKQLLEKTGGYNKKSYKLLLNKINKYKNRNSILANKLQKMLRQLILERLSQRTNYFVSYMNQSKFALARIHDMALGSKISIEIAGQRITEKSVKKSYEDYLNTAKTTLHNSPRNRRAAMVRLSELEIDYYEQIIAEETLSDENLNDANKHLDISISLIDSALTDYPEHKNNDKLLYQLVKAYDKRNKQTESLAVMRQLVDNYPHSRFYTEIQFKLGEEYLIGNDSIDAELAYSAAIQRGADNSLFYQRALYKRGWSRLRQSIYDDALEDFFEVLTLSNFTRKQKISSVDKEQLNDILRAISLCFVNMGGLENLNDYFKYNIESPHAYLAYENLGELYQSQDRIHDAVSVYRSFIKNFTYSPHAPQFMLKIITVWEDSGFQNNYLQARKNFDISYKLDGKFWEKNKISEYENVKEALKSNIVYMASHHHNRFQNNKNVNAFTSAKYWYDRYLKYFSTEKDAGKTRFMFAELLSDANELEAALTQYNEAAKFDSIKSSSAEAAYASLVTLDALTKKNDNKESQDKWLLKKVALTVEFAKNHPQDKRVSESLLHVLERLHSRKMYKRAIQVADRFPNLISKDIVDKVKLIKAHSLFGLQEYSQAESAYSHLLNQLKDNVVAKYDLEERLASSIYKQAEFYEKNGELSFAIENYLKVYTKVPGASISPIAEYDAASLLIKKKELTKAVFVLERFQKKFPQHKLMSEVTKKLAVVYLDSTQKSKSAIAFEKAARDQSNKPKFRHEAMWQAAELYEGLGNNQKIIELYTLYTKELSADFEQKLEARYKLVKFYEKKRDLANQNYWYRDIVTAIQDANENEMTDRVKYLAATASMKLINTDIALYNSIKIEEPLKITLTKKKKVMKKIVNALFKVNDYSIAETSTQALYRIAETYTAFSSALLNSPRPKHLKDIELEQYDMLLEEQAYPFEEKALLFYKTNLKSVKSGVYNEWIHHSFKQLAKMLPARYGKKEKMDLFVETEEQQTNLAVR